MIASPIRIDGERPGGRAAAALGADTEALLAETGLGRVEIDELRSDGAI